MADSRRHSKKSFVSLPLGRVSTIMKSSPEVASVSTESVLLTTKAAELFVGHLAQLALGNSRDGKSLEYSDVAKLVNSNEKFSFLRDVVPQKMTVAQYKAILKEVEENEREMGINNSGHEDQNSSKNGHHDSDEDNEDEDGVIRVPD